MKIVRLLPFVLLFLFFVVDLPAVQQEFKFTKIDFSYRRISSQDTNVDGFDRAKLGSLGRTQNWGMIEATYESLPKWADDVELKYFVLMKGEKKGKPVMLAGSITYIHIQHGTGHVSTIYIPPQAAIRYEEVLKVRAELWYNGVLQDSIKWPRASAGKTPWWTRVKPAYGSLFSRFYTPFEHEQQLREEVIKME